jgi:hypothetical protein
MMRSKIAILLFAGVFLTVASAFAQRRAVAAAPIAPARPVTGQRAAPTSSGALGGSFASIGISRPLGGIAPPVTTTRRNPGSPYRYVGPIYYVPSYSDFGGFQPTYSTFNTPASVPPLYYPGAAPSNEPAPPVIINQYFGSRRVTTQNEDGGFTTSDSPAPLNPGDPAGASDKYYLIAYKDRSVYSALAYWVEGDTLHYVTTQNTHNQASLALLDLERTTKLNADSGMPFSLAGK